MTEKSTWMLSARPAASSRSNACSRPSRPVSQPSGATSARTSAMAARPPRMRASLPMAWANTGGTPCAPSPAVSSSSVTKFDVWYASSTAWRHCGAAPQLASSARSTDTDASAILKSATPASLSDSASRPTTSASAAAPAWPMSSTPICVVSRGSARVWPSASRNTRCM